MAVVQDTRGKNEIPRGSEEEKLIPVQRITKALGRGGRWHLSRIWALAGCQWSEADG